MFDDHLARRRTSPSPSPSPTVARRHQATTPTDVVLGLQQRAGNRATGRWLDDVALQRQDDDAVRADSERRTSGDSTATVDGIGVFELLSFSLRNQDRGATAVGDIQVVLRGQAVQRLAEAAAQGRPIKRVVLRSGRVTVTVTDCVVAAFSTSGDEGAREGGGGSGGATANVTFNGTITFEVAPATP